MIIKHIKAFKSNTSKKTEVCRPGPSWKAPSLYYPRASEQNRSKNFIQDGWQILRTQDQRSTTWAMTGLFEIFKIWILLYPNIERHGTILLSSPPKLSFAFFRVWTQSIIYFTTSFWSSIASFFLLDWGSWFDKYIYSSFTEISSLDEHLSLRKTSNIYDTGKKNSCTND